MRGKKILVAALVVLLSAIVTLPLVGCTVAAGVADTEYVDDVLYEVYEPTEPEDEPVCEYEQAALREASDRVLWAAMDEFWLAYYEANRPADVDEADDADVAATDGGTAASTAPPANSGGGNGSGQAPPPANNNGGGQREPTITAPGDFIGENQWGGNSYGAYGVGCLWCGPVPNCGC